MCNSLLLTNSTAQSIAAGGIVPLGSAVHGFGKDIILNGNRINLRAAGHYDIEAVFTGLATAATPITLTMYEGAVPVTSVSVTPAAAGAAVTLPLIWNSFIRCNCNSTAIYFELSGAATEADFVVEVKK